MVNELFAARTVRDEFVGRAFNGYTRHFNRPQLDAALYILNDFIANVESNGLAFIRYVEPAPPPQPQYAAPQPQYPPPPQYMPPIQAAYPQQPYQYPLPDDVNPFGDEPQYTEPEEEEIPQPSATLQRNVDELNSQLQSRMPSASIPPRGRGRPPKGSPALAQPAQIVQRDNIDLGPQKPKSFVESIRQMKIARKPDRINPEE